MTAKQTEVVIVGAGVAGLAAAQELCCHGTRVVLVEARERVGGRIHTLHPPGVAAPIELGAEFIHGKPPNLFQLIRRFRLKPQQLSGELWCSENRGLNRCDELFDEVDKIFEAMEPTARDLSFAEFLHLRGKKFSKKARQWALSYVEGFHAADPNRISVRSLVKSNQADEEIDGDQQFRLADGYDRLVHSLMRQLEKRGVELMLNTAVTRVEWRPGEVSMDVNRPDRPTQRLVASAAITTVPLGVLKNAARTGGMEFYPALAQKRRGLEGLEMGAVVRVSFKFKRRFWAEKQFSINRNRARRDLSRMGFLFAPQAAFPTWWSTMPRKAPVLTAWTAGPRADRLANLNSQEKIHLAIDVLAQILKVDVGWLENLVEAAYTHDWQADPFSRGAYCYALVGGANASRELAEPVADTLFFAGEATDYNGHHGTVHGALASGTRAAQEILQLRSHRLAS